MNIELVEVRMESENHFNLPSPLHAQFHNWLHSTCLTFLTFSLPELLTSITRKTWLYTVKNSVSKINYYWISAQKQLMYIPWVFSIRSLYLSYWRREICGLVGILGRRIVHPSLNTCSWYCCISALWNWQKTWCGARFTARNRTIICDIYISTSSSEISFRDGESP